MERRIGCHYYFYDGSTFTKHVTTACWAGIQSVLKKKDVKNIYIEQYLYTETKAYIPLLIKLINKITPCEIVKVNKKDYIKYTLLEYYDQNLILLNFIRNLWDCPFAGYTKKFFDKLSTSTYIDPLKRLTISNKVACEKYNGSPGHSNAGKGANLILKSKEQLLNWKDIKGNIRCSSTQQFLTS